MYRGHPSRRDCNPSTFADCRSLGSEWSTEVCTCKESLTSQLLFDAKQLVVLCQALTTARRSCLDLAGPQADDKVSDERVLCLTRAVGDHNAPPVAHGHGGRVDG